MNIIYICHINITDYLKNKRNENVEDQFVLFIQQKCLSILINLNKFG